MEVAIVVWSRPSLQHIKRNLYDDAHRARTGPDSLALAAIVSGTSKWLMDQASIVRKPLPAPAVHPVGSAAAGMQIVAPEHAFESCRNGACVRESCLRRMSCRVQCLWLWVIGMLWPLTPSCHLYATCKAMDSEN